MKIQTCAWMSVKVGPDLHIPTTGAAQRVVPALSGGPGSKECLLLLQKTQIHPSTHSGSQPHAGSRQHAVHIRTRRQTLIHIN